MVPIYQFKLIVYINFEGFPLPVELYLKQSYNPCLVHIHVDPGTRHRSGVMDRLIIRDFDKQSKKKNPKKPHANLTIFKIPIGWGWSGA